MYAEKSVDVSGAAAGGGSNAAAFAAAHGVLAIGGFVEAGFQRTHDEEHHSFVTSAGLAVRAPAFAALFAAAK